MNFEQLNPAACRTYLIVDDDKNAVLIDPVIPHVSDYLKLLKERNLTLTHIVDTHTHADHISAGPSLRDATDCAYVMHHLARAKCVTMHVSDGDILTLAGQKATVIETPGHTQDSISLLFADKILTGDFLFLEDAGAGRDDLPGGDATAHYNSLKKLKPLSGDLMVYPAHEYRDRQPSPLENQRQKNPHLKDRSEKEFVSYIEDLKLGPADWMKKVLAANYRCSTDPNAAWIPLDVPACEIKGTLNPNAGDIAVDFVDVAYVKGLTDAIVLDVREPSELVGELGAIKTAINIPVGRLAQAQSDLSDDKSKEIITVCRSGGRATTAAQILITAGYNNVKVMQGGMIAYRT
jgi:sulfur dioxygenase